MCVLIRIASMRRFQWEQTTYVKENLKCPYKASWSGAIINPHWLELPLSRTNFPGPKLFEPLKFYCTNSINIDFTYFLSWITRQNKTRSRMGSCDHLSEYWCQNGVLSTIEKPCELSSRHSFNSVFIKLCQKVCYHLILTKFETGSCRVKN